MTYIDVLDTAVKIGLGALISAVAAHLVAKHSHTREMNKIAYVRRQETLEDLADNAERHFSAWRMLASALGGAYSGNNPPNPDFNENQWKFIRKRDQEFMETHESLGRAIARIKLLGIDGAATAINTFIRSVKEFRDPLIVGGKTPTREDFERVRKAVNKSISDFYSAMSAVHSKFPD